MLLTPQSVPQVQSPSPPHIQGPFKPSTTITTEMTVSQAQYIPAECMIFILMLYFLTIHLIWHVNYKLCFKNLPSSCLNILPDINKSL